MIHRVELELCVNALLNCNAFDDYCINGLQVEGKEEIQRIICGVSVSKRLFEESVKHNADAVIVHHGLFWCNTPSPLAITGVVANRMKTLIKGDLNLFAYHLPLDAHPVIGNNAQIANLIGLADIQMAPVEGISQPIAAVGELEKPLPFTDLINRLNEVFKVNGTALKFRDRIIRRVFVISGGGASFCKDAALSGADLMITGELREDSVRYAEELGISLYAFGHYNSEKFGVKALGEYLIEKFNLEVTFVDIPNPI